MSRTYRKRNFCRTDEVILKEEYLWFLDSFKRCPDVWSKYLYECDNFECWIKARKKVAISDGSYNSYSHWNDGYCNGPVHPTSGKILGWSDGLSRGKDMKRYTNRMRRNVGKELIKEGIYEYVEERN